MSAATIEVNILGNASSLESALSGAKGKLDSFASGMTSIGTNLSLAITAPVAGISAVAINATADFSRSMNTIQAVTGATEGQMQSLQESALHLGAVTTYSAGEAAAAMLALSKAGFDADQTLAAIPGVLDMAAASGMGLDEAATLTTKAIKAFGLEASDSASVANVLAAAAVSSAADIRDLSLGLQMSSAVANTFGQDLDTTTAALALLNDNALRGSDAGTSLKTAMQRIYAPTDEAARVLNQLGVSAYDAEGKARPLFEVLLDMQGAMYGMNEVTVVSGGRTAEQAERMKYLQSRIKSTSTELQNYASGIAGVRQSEEKKAQTIDQLNRELVALQNEYNSLAGIQGTASTVMRQYTEEERNAMLQTLGGSDAIRALSILLGQSEADMQAMIEAVSQQGKATEIADARMKGLGGAFEYFRGSVESTLIAAVLPYEDAISNMIRGAADLISSFSNLSPEVKNLAIGFALLAAAVGPAMVGLGTGIKIFSFLAGPTIPAISAALAALFSPIGLVVAGIVALGVAVWSLNLGDIQGKVQGVTEAFGAWLSNASSVKDNLSSIWATFQQFMSGEISLPDLGASLQTEIGKMGETLKGLFTGDAFTKLQEDVVAALDLQGLVAGVQFAINGFDWSNMTLDKMSNLLKVAILGAINVIDWAGVGEGIRGFVDGLAASINAVDWTQIGSDIGAFFSGITSAFVNFVAGGTDQDQALGEVLNDRIMRAWAVAMTLFDPEALQESFVGLKDAVLAAISGLWTGFDTATGMSEAVAGFKDQLNAALDAQNLIDGLAGAITAIDWAKAGFDLSAMVRQIAADIMGTDWTQIGVDFVNSIKSVFSTGGEKGEGLDWSKLIDAAKAAIEAIDWGGIGDAFSTLGTAILDAIEALLKGIVSQIELPDVGGAVNNAVEGAQNAVGGALDAVGGVFGLGGDKKTGSRALGGAYTPAGLYLVGESGPELVQFGSAARVYNNRETQGMTGGVTINVNAQVASNVDIHELALRLKSEFDRRAR